MLSFIGSWGTHLGRKTMLSTESHSLSLLLLIRLTVTLALAQIFIPQMKLFLNKDIRYKRGIFWGYFWPAGILLFCISTFVHNRDVTSLLECAAGWVTLLLCAKSHKSGQQQQHYFYHVFMAQLCLKKYVVGAMCSNSWASTIYCNSLFTEQMLVKLLILCLQRKLVL